MSPITSGCCDETAVLDRLEKTPKSLIEKLSNSESNKYEWSQNYTSKKIY